MGTSAGRVQGNGCGRRVPVGVDLSELDPLVAGLGPKVIASGGFTLLDMLTRYNLKRTSAQRRIDTLVTAGKVKQIGVRPGPGQEKVYEIVT